MPNATTYPVMTMAEMERAYDQEWVLIVDYELDPTSGSIVYGQVAAHGVDKDALEDLVNAIDPKRFGICFIGRPPRDGAYRV